MGFRSYFGIGLLAGAAGLFAKHIGMDLYEHITIDVGVFAGLWLILWEIHRSKRDSAGNPAAD